MHCIECVMFYLAKNMMCRMFVFVRPVREGFDACVMEYVNKTGVQLLPEILTFYLLCLFIRREERKHVEE